MAERAEALKKQVAELRGLELKWLKWGEEQLLDMPHLLSVYRSLVAPEDSAEDPDDKEADPSKQLPHLRNPPPSLHAPGQSSLWSQRGWQKVISTFNLMTRIRSQIVMQRNTVAHSVREIPQLEQEAQALLNGEDPKDHDPGDAVSDAEATALWLQHMETAKAMLKLGTLSTAAPRLDLSAVTRLLSSTLRGNSMLQSLSLIHI